jgi:hypothetical protein
MVGVGYSIFTMTTNYSVGDNIRGSCIYRFGNELWTNIYEIDKIFLSSEKACKYVIEGQGQFQHNDYYKKFTEVELMEQALHFVLEFEVE